VTSLGDGVADRSLFNIRWWDHLTVTCHLSL